MDITSNQRIFFVNIKQNKSPSQEGLQLVKKGVNQGIGTFLIGENAQ